MMIRPTLLGNIEAKVAPEDHNMEDQNNLGTVKEAYIPRAVP
jgi:hypothetical protein